MIFVESDRLNLRIEYSHYDYYGALTMYIQKITVINVHVNRMKQNEQDRHLSTFASMGAAFRIHHYHA